MPERALNRVCYVEDDEDIQRIVRMSLERIGKMTVEVVSDPTAAIEKMAAFRPDLVMLDWMMPVMDGRIGFTDREGGGTVFYFELPRVRAA